MIYGLPPEFVLMNMGMGMMEDFFEYPKALNLKFIFMLRRHYINGKLPTGFKPLLYSRILQFIAIGLLDLFLPVFLFIKLEYSSIYVFLYYLIGYLIYGLSLPVVAHVINKIGLRRALRYSTFFDAAFYVCFFLFDRSPFFLLAVSIFSLTISRLLFWLPFNTNIAVFTDQINRGKEISLLWTVKSLLKVVMPILSGFVIASYGFNIVFVMAIFFILLSGLPYFFMPSTHEKFSWTIKETVLNFFKKENRRLVLANIANGAENVASLIIWPIFIWQLLEGNFLEVGALSSLIVLVSVVIQLFAGSYCDVFSKRKMLHWGSLLYALGWLAKVFVLSPFQIFVVGTYHNIAQIFKDTPFDTINYEMMANHGHFVDEYTVLKEMAIMYGRVIMLAISILVAFNFGMNWTFALAAMASLFVNLL
jgi:YQGE family putative transporter